ncbi:hypothetical protein [Schinkia azotoformans]|uniref:hypothetical protein n=1 Tax=Schinkia azotoformans TaxID=1454 RepID=UPI002DB8A989|nr:hypothetical protein [Schinkia azotoformans]MEC1715922.1 hypothetical protein [Schinkia azotoformans]MEC1741561.1 hypothetical protein [Schinkia azotoformans]MEC1744555.1 hypothetical protein [Schinkia azotoformans]MEC1758454.1 hypothetical protein [Schinkia azotoformans]MEC1765256.1 hypothetical protein [Schinkia azotoformans]
MLQGDTVRLKVHFKDFNGQSVNPTNVKLTIYDTNKTQIEQFILDDTYKLDVGVFFYDYTTAIELSEFIFEFSGSYNNKSILVRDSVKIQFN